MTLPTPHRLLARPWAVVLAVAVIGLGCEPLVGPPPCSICPQPPPPPPPLPRVAAIDLTPAQDTVEPGWGRFLLAVPRDSLGRELPYDVFLEWSVADSTVARIVTTAGQPQFGRNAEVAQVTGTAAGVTTVTVRALARTATASLHVVQQPSGFVAIQAGSFETCGLTSDGTAYCWGNDVTNPYIPSFLPMRVAGGLKFSSLGVGDVGDHACGVTAGGAAYCWGVNDRGQLGNGATTASYTPAAVTGGLSFQALSTGFEYTCGITTGGVTYCWGTNFAGQLGNGTTSFYGATPAPSRVTTLLTFVTVSAGGDHTCALTASGDAYCWGANFAGQLGDGTTTDSPTPMAVASGLSFTAISAGFHHTCGVTTDGAAYCWGSGADGVLGRGDTASSALPAAVVGGLAFQSISAGSSVTCGGTVAGAAYCWGSNGNAQLGDGSRTDSAVPVAVAGGLVLRAISAAGATHSCGVTTAGIAYCWGQNFYGQIGDGTGFTDHLTPARVTGQP